MDTLQFLFRCPCIHIISFGIPAVTPFVEKMAKRMDDMAEAAELEVGIVC